MTPYLQSLLSASSSSGIGPSLEVGTFALQPPVPRVPKEWKPHLTTPWGEENLKRFDLAPNHDPYTIPHQAFSRHALIVGGTGVGKTVLSRMILAQQLQMGHSAVILEAKEEGIASALEIIPEGVPVTVVHPHFPIPGLNPFLVPQEEPTNQIQDFVEFVIGYVGEGRMGFGPMLDGLNQLTALMVAHELSIVEMVRCITNDAYRNALLKLDPKHDSLPFQEAIRYFTEEHAGKRVDAVKSALGPLINKLRHFLTNPFLKQIVCAEENTLDLASLWDRQQVIVVCVDARRVSAFGVRALSGLFTRRLFAERGKSGNRPVVFAVDEASFVLPFIEDVAADIAAIARSSNLRLLWALQNEAQVSNKAFLNSMSTAGVRAFFKLSEDDAKRFAPNLASAAEPPTDAKLLVKEEHQNNIKFLDVTLVRDQEKAIALFERMRKDGPPTVGGFLIRLEMERLLSLVPLQGGDALFAWIMQNANGMGKVRYEKQEFRAFSSTGGRELMNALQNLVRGSNPDAAKKIIGEHMPKLSYPSFSQIPLHGVSRLEKGLRLSLTVPWFAPDREFKAPEREALSQRLQKLAIGHCIFRIDGAPSREIRIRRVVDSTTTLADFGARPGKVADVIGPIREARITALAKTWEEAQRAEEEPAKPQPGARNKPLVIIKNQGETDDQAQN